MFDKLLTRTSTHAQHDIDEQLCRQRQTIQTSLATLKSMGRIILDESIADSALRPSLFAEIPREDLAAQLEAVTEWVTGKKSDLFHGIVRRFGTLRKFSPTLLQALEFLPDAEGEKDRLHQCPRNAQGDERDRPTQAAGRYAHGLLSRAPARHNRARRQAEPTGVGVRPVAEAPR